MKNIVHLILLFIVISISTTPTAPVTGTIIGPSTDIHSGTSLIAKSAVFGGEDHLVVNQFSNGGFENFDNNHFSDLNSYGSGYNNVTEYYESTVNSGTYSVLVETAGNGVDVSNNYLTRSFPNSGDILKLDGNLRYNISIYINNPVLDEDAMVMISFSIRDSNTGNNNNLYYRLSTRNTGFSNYSQNANFIMNSSLSSWNSLSLDLTGDFQAAFGTTTNRYLNSMLFQLRSGTSEVDVLQMVIDDVSLQNDTKSDFISNGGFESGLSSTGYYTYSKTVPTHITQSLDHSSGKYAARIASSATNIQQSSSGSLGRRYTSTDFRQYITPGVTKVSFDWKLHMTQSGLDSSSGYVYLYFQNQTYSASVSYFLGLQNTLYSNFTTQPTYSIYYIASPNFGTQDTWVHEELDIAAFLSDLNLTNVYLETYRFYTELGTNENSSVELLVDQATLLNYPTVDPGFEIEGFDSSNNPLGTWSTTGSSLAVQSRSSDAHSGNWSASIHVPGNNYSRLRRDVLLDFSRTLYLDLWWKISGSTITDGTLAYVELQFDGGQSLYYVLADGGGNYLTNSSTIGYFLVDGVNHQDNWYNLRKNIREDSDIIFGYHKSRLVSIGFYTNASPSSDVTLLFDDVHFIADTTAPQITGIVVDPVSDYLHPTNVSVDVTDVLSDVAQVSIRYYDNVSWKVNSLDFIAGDTYGGDIPAVAYGVNVMYRIEAIDTSGNLAILDNGGANYTYFVDDFTAPIIQFKQPYNNSNVNGNISLVVAGIDIASDVRNVSLMMDQAVLASNNSSEVTYQLNTRQFVNGPHTFMVTVYDNEGNAKNSSITLVFDNDLDAPLITDPVRSPVSPDEEVTVYLGVTDRSQITRVSFFYRLNNGSYTKLELNQTGSLYQTTIPAATYGDTISYYVEAEDFFGQVATSGTADSPYSYSIPEKVTTSTTSLNQIESLQQQVEDYYQQYEFFVGMGATLLIFGLIRLLRWRLGKRSKK